MDTAPPERDTIFRRNSRFIPSILGIVWGARNLVFVEVEWLRLEFTNYDVPQGQSGMGQVGVLDRCCLDGMAARDRRDNQGGR